MNISSLDSNLSLKNNGDELASEANRSVSQKKMADINKIVKSNLARQHEIDSSPLQPKSHAFDPKKIGLSKEFKILINKIQQEQDIGSDEILIQVLIRFGANKAELLTAELKNIGIQSCRLTDIFFLLFSNTGLWFYEIKNRNEGISSIDESSFILLPKQFTDDRLNTIFRLKVFNPLNANVKNHMYAYLISAFLNAKPKPSIAWEEFIKQNNISVLIDDIISTSQVLREIIFHPNYYSLCEYAVSNFMDNFEEREFSESNSRGISLEGFEFALNSYNFLNKFLFTQSVDYKNSANNLNDTSQVNISRDMYWFYPPKYEQFIQEIKLIHKDNNYKLSELFVKELYNFSRILNSVTHNISLAKHGRLTYQAWLKKTFNQTSTYDEGNFKFRSRLNYQSNLLRYFISSFQHLFYNFVEKFPHGFPYNPGRDQFTLEIIKYYLNYKPDRAVIKHTVVKNHYDLMNNFFKCFDLNMIFNNIIILYNQDLDWLQRIKFFLSIEGLCKMFRTFSYEFIKLNEELQKYLETASNTERVQIEREYDLVKSHFMLPIFILNSLSIMEGQLKQLKILDLDKVSIDLTPDPPESHSYLDEINKFFIEDRYFQSRPEDLEKKQQEVSQIDDHALPPNLESQVSSRSLETDEIPPADEKAAPQKSETQPPSVQLPEAALSLNEKTPEEKALQKLKPSAPKPIIPPLAMPLTAVTTQSDEKEVSFTRGIKVRKLIKELRDLGFDFNRQTGSHAIFKLHNQQVVVPTSNDTLPRGTLESIEERVNEIVNNNKSQS